ncbi:MAG: tetratricopeptide repeat protein [Planctomycetaceae bacterium]|nr:tetratricopeptide repeat protein [Planctomycetaceae bacterium]
MKNIVFTVALSFLFALGCQTSHNSRWLTPPKGQSPPKGQGKIFGQAPSDDPFPFPVIHPVQPVSNPAFEPFAPVQQHAMIADLAAEEAERERLRTLATTNLVGAPTYLQPFNPWNGPFATRVRKRNLEQEFILQTGGPFEPVNGKQFIIDEPLFDWELEEEKKRFDWTILDPSTFFTRVRDWMGMGPDEGKANEAMRKGREILLTNPDLSDRKKNQEAAKHFAAAAKRFPNSVLEEDALHLAGECYYFAEDYPNAMNAYQQLMIKYRHSKHLDNAARRLFRIGQYWEREAERSFSSFNVSNKTLPRYDTFGFAKKSYETVFMNDPLGPISDDALMALATAYYKRGRYQGDDNYNRAAMYYKQLREEYPLSSHIARAYENELYARTQAYLGAEHPSRTLEEAKKLAEITMRQFGSELGSESRVALMEIQETILDKKAERLWTMGRFYDGKRYYGSARMHYNELIAEYPQSEFAERARRRMVAIEGLPDTPPILGFPINPFKTNEW